MNSVALLLKRALKGVTMGLWRLSKWAAMAVWKFATTTPPADPAQRENTRRMMAKLRGEAKGAAKEGVDAVRQHIEKDWDKPSRR